ncbi:MAG: sodium:solute symporter family protein [Candidatus Kapabacteria bacterium]|nr:sodium:solute symporter family protein [Ignavibacteriota bacterium]MCW5885573.1 sodium:solute symporter family protein [Candidatus Kapabacteria bacterium]
MTLEIADILIIVIYFAIVLYVGFVVAGKKERKSESKEEYLLAGRKLTLPLFVASLVATWYGSILGIGEFVYTSGFVAWVCFGLPYYIAAGIFAYFLAGKIRSSNVTSIPEQIRMKYGKYAGIAASVIVLVITIPAAYILMLGVIIQLFSGWSLWFSIIIGAVLSLIYLFTGGFRADVYTNTAQFVLMYLGFALLLVFALINYGSIGDMLTLLPENHKTFKGDYNWQFLIAWFIIAFQTFVDPSFHQRCSAATSPKTARNGIFVSIAFWAVFDFLTLTTGLFAKAYLNIENPLMSFPLLGEAVLPAFFKGLFVVSLLATVMSTLDSYAFLSALTIGNDILSNFKKFSKFSTQSLTKAGLIITGIVGVIIAIAMPSAVEIIYKTASVAVPGLIFPLTLSMNSKFEIKPKSALLIMISSSLISLSWTFLKAYEINFFKDIEPMFPGIIFAFILTLFFIKKVAHNESFKFN